MTRAARFASPRVVENRKAAGMRVPAAGGNAGMHLRRWALILMAFASGGLNAQDMGRNARAYIILRTSGTVRDADTRLIAETTAASAREALESSLPEDARGWAWRNDGDPPVFACIEDPRTFVSDRVDRYVAVEGSAVRNRKGEFRFLFYVATIDRFADGEGFPPERKIWAPDARTALATILRDLEYDWGISATGRYEAEAVKPDDLGTAYRVRTIYKPSRRGKRALSETGL